MHHRMPLLKTEWAILNLLIFPPVMRIVLEYHLFPGLKKKLKNRHFSSDADIGAAET
jgi:hypothetical protein